MSISEIKEITKEPNIIVFTRQTYSSLEKDIFALAVNQLDTGMNIQADLFANKTVTVSAKMLSSVTEKQYARLKACCSEMAKKQIEISDDTKEEFEFIQPFPRIKYRKGVIELTMFADVVQSFMELKNGYSEYYIKEILSLEQVNKKRMYEMFSSYKNRKINTWKVYDSELKHLLGMQQTEYKSRHKEFGQKVIEVCVSAINEKTSLSVDFERDKDSDGWFTVFKINKKTITQPQNDEPMPQDERSLRAIERLKSLNVRQDYIKKIIINYQPEFWKWMTQNKENIENKKFKNPAGVLLVHLGLIEPKF